MRIEVAFPASVDFGHGQNTGVGGSDPTFAHGSVAKVNCGSLLPNKKLHAVRACAARI